MWTGLPAARSQRTIAKHVGRLVDTARISERISHLLKPRITTECHAVVRLSHYWHLVLDGRLVDHRDAVFSLKNMNTPDAIVRLDRRRMLHRSTNCVLLA